MTDGYKYIDVFYDLQTLSQFKVELNTLDIIGKVSFSFLFFSDQGYTGYLGETTKPDLVIGSNLFQSGLLQLGNMTLYVIGRIKLLPGSSLSLSSLKLNDYEHMETGTLLLESESLFFVDTLVQSNMYHSVNLGKIQDPSFQIQLQVLTLTGLVGLEYLYYQDEACTLLSSIQTTPLVVGNNQFQVETLGKYVVFRVKMLNGSHTTLSSFKLQNNEQGILVFTTPAYIDDTIVVSETCFPSGTRVKTDQGTLEIQKLIPHYHTIQGKSVVALTSTYSSDKELVSIRKDSIRKHYPNHDTLISRKHKIYMKGKLKAAYRLAESYKGVTLVPYKGQMLYNVLLEDYGIMNIHGLLCETLHPMNPMANLFRELYKDDRNKIETRESFLIQ
jgi:hypothetical protein